MQILSKFPTVFYPYMKRESFRYFTYAIVSAEQLQLWMNAIILGFSGVSIEIIHGMVPVFVIFCFGIISGLMFTEVVDSQILYGCGGGTYVMVL